MEDTREQERACELITVRPAVKDMLSNLARRLVFEAGGYNKLMAAADRIITNSPADSHDESFYLWALAFFMELARGFASAGTEPLTLAVECVGRTLGMEALTFVHTQLTTYADGLDTDRFDKKLWNKRLVLATRAFSEQLAWADALVRCSDSDLQALGRTLALNVIYEPQLRDLLPQLLRRYKESRHCRAFLRALVGATHTQLRLFDGLADSGHKTLVVANKTKAARPKKPSKSSKPEKRLVEKPRWDEISEPIREALKEESDIYTPFFEDPAVKNVIDPAVATGSDQTDEIHKETVKRIGELLILHRSNPMLAVAALRLSRQLFPEHADKHFGGSFPTTLSEDEVYLEQVFNSIDEVYEEVDINKENLVDMEYSDSDSEYGDSAPAAVSAGREHHVDVVELAIKFCSVAGLQPYIALLETWQTNGQETNHHLARMFKRVAIDWKLPAMLYQVRIFIICQQVLKAVLNHKVGSEANEIAAFAKFCVNGFVKLAKEIGPVAFAEALFCKSRTDALAMQENYENLRTPAVVDVADEENTGGGKKSKGKKGDKNNDGESPNEEVHMEIAANPWTGAASSESENDGGDDDDIWDRFKDDDGDEPRQKKIKKPRKKRTEKQSRKRKASSLEPQEEKNEEDSSKSNDQDEAASKRAKLLSQLAETKFVYLLRISFSLSH